MYELNKLNYSFSALEPYLDTVTMEIHYNKHHQTYCNNFNAIIEKYPDLAGQSAEDVLKNLNELPVSEADRQKIRNQGGGFVNHNFYWQIMDPAHQKNEKLIDDINKKFGSVEKFKELFTQTATQHFGSGWTWLVYNKNGELELYSLPNQDSPLTLGHEPILALDVWEHAYYLKYQNRRADFINAWWNTIKFI